MARRRRRPDRAGPRGLRSPTRPAVRLLGVRRDLLAARHRQSPGRGHRRSLTHHAHPLKPRRHHDGSAPPPTAERIAGRPDGARRRAARRHVRDAGHLQPQGVHSADVPLQRLVRLLHVRAATGTRRAAVPGPRRRVEDRPAGSASRLSRGAVHARRTTRGPLRGRSGLAARPRVRLDRALRRRDGRAGGARDRAVAACECGRALRRRARTHPPVQPESGDDDRVGQPGPRGPPRRPRQDPGAAACHARRRR